MKANKENAALAQAEQTANEVATVNNTVSDNVGMSALTGVLDKATKAEAVKIDAVVEYWTPTQEGETRRLIFYAAESREIPDFNNKKNMITKKTAVFLEPKERIDQATGEVITYGKPVYNASARLVSLAEKLDKGTIVDVTYEGRKKNKTNNNSSDYWAVFVVPTDNITVDVEAQPAE